jgi:hypothetical protein
MSVEEQAVHKAAAGIFDMLPEDPFGEGTGVDTIGRPESEEAPATEEVAVEDLTAEDRETDDDAAKSIRGEEDEPEDEDDEEEYDEDDETSEGEADEEEGQDSTETPRFTVKVDGEEQEVPLDELLAGYSRTASWTRKSQALAAEKKGFETERTAVQQERAALTARLQEAEEVLASQLPEEPSPADPQAWIRYQQERQRLESVRAERAALEQKMHEEWQREQDAKVAAENERLVEFFPEWQDESVALAAKGNLAKYAIGTLGFDESDVAGITDHRVVLLLQKAYDFDQLQEKGGAVKAKARTSKTLMPGKSSSRSSSSKAKSKKRATAKRDNLRKSGHVRDAAALIHDMLDE